MTDSMHEFTKLITAHIGHCPRGRKNRIRFLALAMAGEAGEMANFVKKEWRGDYKDKPIAAAKCEQKMIAELADVANYAFMLAKVLNVDLPAMMLAKFIEVGNRPQFRDYGK